MSSTKRSVSPKDIEQLNSELLTLSTQTALITPSSNNDAYTKSIARWSSAAVKPAGAVLVPTSAPQIQCVVKYCTENAIDLAVKGGGHSTAGVSSTNGGLLIDLGNSPIYSKVTVDTEKKHLHVGGGANWGQVDEAAFPHGLVSVGGTVADTGVGGLSLGGGYGWLSGLVGLVIDNLLQITLVTAQGEIVTASPTENTELFWALRGAGPNFGVVTEFVIQAHAYGSDRASAIAGAKGSQTYAGMAIFPADDPALIDAIVTATNSLYQTHNFGQGGRSAMAGLGAGGFAIAKPPPLNGQTAIMVPLIYHGPEDAARKAFEPILSLPKLLMNTAAMLDYPAINHLLDVPPGLRVSMKGSAFTLPVAPRFAHELLASFETFTAAVPDAHGTLILFELYDPAAVVGRAGNADCAFANRGWHFNGMIAPIWTDAANDARCRGWARDVAALFKGELERAGRETGKGVEGGVGVRGSEGAVMMYGNYDREFVFLCPPPPPLFFDFCSVSCCPFLPLSFLVAHT